MSTDFSSVSFFDEGELVLDTSSKDIDLEESREDKDTRKPTAPADKKSKSTKEVTESKREKEDATPMPRKKTEDKDKGTPREAATTAVAIKKEADTNTSSDMEVDPPTEHSQDDAAKKRGRPSGARGGKKAAPKEKKPTDKSPAPKSKKPAQTTSRGKARSSVTEKPRAIQKKTQNGKTSPRELRGTAFKLLFRKAGALIAPADAMEQTKNCFRGDLRECTRRAYYYMKGMRHRMINSLHVERALQSMAKPRKVYLVPMFNKHKTTKKKAVEAEKTN